MSRRITGVSPTAGNNQETRKPIAICAKSFVTRSGLTGLCGLAVAPKVGVTRHARYESKNPDGTELAQRFQRHEVDLQDALGSRALTLLYKGGKGPNWARHTQYIDPLHIVSLEDKWAKK